METDGFTEIKKTMGREDVAVLDLVIALQKRESGSADNPEKTVLSFDHGYTANQILETVKNGNKDELPIFNKDGDYAVFGWIKAGTREFGGEQEEYVITGSNDIRLYRNVDDNFSLKLFANSAGTFMDMEKDFDEVLNKIDYPIFAEDRQGLRFENNSYKNKAKH